MLGRTLRVAGELGGPGSAEMLREAYDLLLGPSVARFELACAELALARVTGRARGAGAAAARGAGPGRRLRLAGALLARCSAELVALGLPARRRRSRTCWSSP